MKTPRQQAEAFRIRALVFPYLDEDETDDPETQQSENLTIYFQRNADGLDSSEF